MPVSLSVRSTEKILKIPVMIPDQYWFNNREVIIGFLFTNVDCEANNIFVFMVRCLLFSYEAQTGSCDRIFLSGTFGRYGLETCDNILVKIDLFDVACMLIMEVR